MVNKSWLTLSILLLCALLTATGGTLRAGQGAPQSLSQTPPPQRQKTGMSSGEQKCAKAADLVNAVYLQVLARPADGVAMKEQGAKFESGELNVRELVRQLALSDEYTDKFIRQRPVAEAIALLYQHLLARGSQPQESREWVETAQAKGFAPVINGLIDSSEYNRQFGLANVPGHPVRLRACQYVIKLKQEDVIGNGQHMSTELKISGSGQVDTLTRMNNLVVLQGFCAKMAVWLFDERDNVLSIIGPPRDQQWCVETKARGNSERTDEWHGEVSPDIFGAIKSIAILQTPATRIPLDPTRENTEKAMHIKQALK